ncbi:MAG TPA: ATPase [Nitrospiraceae bacterium]|nr:ATPase [Nitrospiraceae bacterium]
MKIHNLTKEEALRTLVTSENGLSEEEAKRRLSEFGFNEIKEAKKKPLYIRFFKQFTHFLALLLWIAAFMSFLSEYLHPGEGMLTLGIAIIAVIFINAGFTFIQEYRAEKALEELKKLLPFYVKVLRDGKEKEIYARDVVHGDVILLSEGDKVPADARLIETSGLRVNNAPLTGESEPVLRRHEAYEGEFIESHNLVFAGTAVVSGSGRAVSFATGMQTEFGRIAHLTGAVEAGLSPLQKEIVKATRVIAVIAAVVGVFFFLLGFLIGRSFWNNFIFAIGITVALIPEGMLPTVTLALAMGSQRMAKRKALIKTLTSVETLGSVTVICTDKTGTLTQNKMAATKVWTIDGGEKARESLLKIAYLCNNARFIEGQYRGDPTEVALLKAARETIGDFKGERIAEIPFDSERKMMTTVYKMQDTRLGRVAEETGYRIQDGKNRASGIMNHASFISFTKGAIEVLMEKSDGILKKGEIVKIDREDIHRVNERMAADGLRVLGIAMRGWDDIPLDMSHENVERGLIIIGLVGIMDPPREEAKEAVSMCKKAGIIPVMITGDHPITAWTIARRIGIIEEDDVHFNTITGRELEKLSLQELEERVEGIKVYARVAPEQKLKIVKALQDKGQFIAMTGDGVNDAPALKRADIGISMGITGTDVAKEASHMILLDDNFATIVKAVKEGRKIYDNIRKFVKYLLSTNSGELWTLFLAPLIGLPIPLLPIHILWINLMTDGLPALALSVEPAETDVMKRPPRDPKESIFAGGLGFFAIWVGLLMAALTLSVQAWSIKTGNSHWQTMVFTVLCLTQLGNALAIRSEKESLCKIGFFSNKAMLGAVLLSFALQMATIYVPFFNPIFKTEPLSFNELMITIGVSSVVFFAVELEKFFRRKQWLKY